MIGTLTSIIPHSTQTPLVQAIDQHWEFVLVALLVLLGVVLLVLVLEARGAVV